MIEADTFVDAAARRAYDFYTGVPCSFLTPLINRIASGVRGTYVAAASEGEAVAIAAGAWLAGHHSIVMCQNSGLGNAVNPLTSLNAPFLIPSLLIVTWRGQPGLPDEPQHELMGRITQDLLSTVGIAHEAFPPEADQVDAVLSKAAAAGEQGRCYALVMSPNSVRDTELRVSPLSPPPIGECHDFSERSGLPSRIELLERLLALVPFEAGIIATTGKCGRELFTLDDREQHLYLVGSMGCASGVGLGISLSTPQRMIVLDGDGAALMKLGTLATIGAYRPKHLLHIIMDNGSYDSTGGQPTTSPSVDFAGIAICCGYALALRADSAEGFARALAVALAADGPALIHARMRAGSLKNLGRPTVKPPEVARRFRAFLRKHVPC